MISLPDLKYEGAKNKNSNNDRKLESPLKAFVNHHSLQKAPTYRLSTHQILEKNMEVNIKVHQKKTLKHSRPRRIEFREGTFLNSRSRRFYDAPYAPSYNPTQLCCFSEKRFQSFSKIERNTLFKRRSKT